MEDMTFEELLKINCFAEEASERIKAADLLEQRYCCEIRCTNMDKSVLFAHTHVVVRLWLQKSVKTS